MNIMKKRISLILGIIMLALAIIPVVSVTATSTCQVSMTAKMGTKILSNNGKYNVNGGETITVTAKTSAVGEGIAFISYFFSTGSYENRAFVYSNKAEITVPRAGIKDQIDLYVEPVATNDDGSPNTITKTGWQKYTLVYPTEDETVKSKDLKVTLNNAEIKNGATVSAKAGDKIVISATPATSVKNVQYKWDTNSVVVKEASSVTFTIPTSVKEGTTYTLKANSYFTDGLFVDGKGETTTTSEKYYFKIAETTVDPAPEAKDLKVTLNGTEIKNGATVSAKAGDKIVISAIPATSVKNVQYKWDTNSVVVKEASSVTFTIPTSVKVGTTYTLKANSYFTDGLFADGKGETTTTSETYYFKIADNSGKVAGDLDIEPWMEENDETEELSISLRNDSEEENKANKNIYELGEVVTYYIDYKNGGKDVSDVSIVLDLPLDFEAVDLNGGKINSDDEIEWILENGLEEGDVGTIIVKVKYTGLKRSRDDANTIYPTASILKGSKVKDVSTVINFIITEYDEEIDIDHEPYMYGDADSDTFRPDYLITRAEGALVLARIYGLDYENVRTITTKYTDIGDTYLEAQKAITAASQAGLINGYLEDDGTYTYRPNTRMTKAEFMKILACMIQESADDQNIDGLEIKELAQLVKVYDDSTRYYVVNGKKVYTHWAIEEITLLARLNMLPLTEDDPEFELDESITRAEVAQLINFYLLRAPAEVTTKTKTGFSDVSRKHDLAGDIIEATRNTHTFSITKEATEVEE